MYNAIIQLLCLVPYLCTYTYIQLYWILRNSGFSICGQYIHRNKQYIRNLYTSSGFLPPTISYVWTYYIVCPVLDVVCYIVYTISYIWYCFTGRTILDVQYSMFILYCMSTYYYYNYIAGQTYDIISHHENILYMIL